MWRCDSTRDGGMVTKASAFLPNLSIMKHSRRNRLIVQSPRSLGVETATWEKGLVKQCLKRYGIREDEMTQ